MSNSPRWDVEGRDWPNAEHSQFVDTGRMRWHVQMMGAGPAMLLLHGTGAATHSWRALAPLLAKHFTIIAPDLAGHGFTTGRPRGGLAMPAMARAVTDLLTQVKFAPELIIGHSAGAAIATRMTLDGFASPRAIVGLDAALLPFPGLAAKLFPAMAKALFVNPFAPRLFAGLARIRGETGRFLKRSTGSAIDAQGVRFYERLLSSPGHVSGALTMMADWDLETLQRALPRLNTPLLLIHGQEDAAIPIGSARKASKLVANGRLVELPGLGHLAHEERPVEVAKIIEQFAGEH